MTTEHIIHSPAEMHELATKLASTLKGGEVITLTGELGAGKTTFVQGLAKAMGVTQPVSSPTFALERQYQGRDGLMLHHYDWYRLDNAQDVQNIGVDDVLGQHDIVAVIEWPDRGAALIPSDTIAIGIDYASEQTRKVIINR